MPTIDELIAQESVAPSSFTPDIDRMVDDEIVGRERVGPLGDPVNNRQATADSNLLNISIDNAISQKQDIDKQNNPALQESRKVGAAAVDNYLASLSPAERKAMPGSEHLDSDFPEFPGLEDDQAPLTPRNGRVVPTLGGRPEATLPIRLNELGLTREFFSNIPEMVKQTFKQQAGGLTMSAGEQLGQDLSWRSRLGRLAKAAGPVRGADDSAEVLPRPVRVAKELGDWASDAIAQGFGLDSTLVEGGQELRHEALARIRDLQPAEKTFMQEVITSGTQSAALALPGMVVSMITRNPTALLAAFGVSTYGDSYGTARDAGKSPEDAHGFALRDAGIEVGTEIGPAKIMIGASKTAIRQTLVRLFKSEMAGETGATIGQKVNSAMSDVETMPLDQWLGELWEELKVTWATTAILTPLQGATAQLAGKAIDKVSGVQDITGELLEISPAEQAAVNQKAARAGKALKAAMFTTAGVTETDLDLSDEQIQRFIDQPELSDITEEQLDAIIGDEANEQRLISELVDRVSGVDEDIPASIGRVGSASLKEISDRWSRDGVDLFTFENDDSISVGNIIVEKDKRKQGLGSKAINDVTDYADSVGKMVTLTPGQKDDLHGTTSRKRLIKFYKRLGFVENKGRNKDFRLQAGSMYRVPQVPASIGEIGGEEISQVEVLLEANDQAIAATPEDLVNKRQENADLRKSESTADFSRQDEFDSWYDETPLASRLGITYDGAGVGGVELFTIQSGLLAGTTKAIERDSEGNIDSEKFSETVAKVVEDNRPQIELAARMGQIMTKFERWAYSDEFLEQLDQEIADAERIGRTEGEIQPTEGRPGAIDEISGRRQERTARDEGRFPGILGERREDQQRLEPFSPEQIESVPLREAVDSGLISEDEGAVIDGFLESLPESLRESFDVVFSGQEFEPTEAQLKAHDIKSAKGFAVRGALLEEIKNEARDTIVMFGGSDITTFFHEFGELSYKRLLTSDERKYVASLKSEAGSKVAPNEWFSDQLQSFVVQEKETVFKPKLQEILSRVADTIRKIWERIRTTHRTPALDEIFRDILAGGRGVQPQTVLGETEIISIEERGEVFSTGTPVTFTFLHNKESATKIFGKPKRDSPHSRYYEPSGQYVVSVTNTAIADQLPDQYDAGLLTLENPLVVDGGGLNGDSWKQRLSRDYGGKRGKKLSLALIADGYDGVVTVSNGHTSEILNLRNFDEAKAVFSIGERSQSDIPEDVRDRFIDEDLAEQYGEAYRQQLNEIVSQSDIEDYQAIAAEASKLAVERTDQHFENQEKLIRSEAKQRAEEIADAEPVSALMDEAISQGRIKLTDQIKADYGLTVTEIINKRPGLFSKDGTVILDEFAIDEGGYKSERDFVEAMANAPSKNELRASLETNFENEDLRFLDQYRDELWQDQFFIEESQAITELLEKKKPAIRKDLKGIIRQQTGQVREDEKTVTEAEALKAAFTKAAQAARVAERAGNKEGVVKEKARMKAILESAKERKQAQEARSKALAQIKKELKSTKIKKQAGKPQGKFTAEIQEIFNTLRADLKLTKVEAFNKIVQNLEDHKENIPPYSVAVENRLLSVIAAQDAGIGRLGFARIQQQGLENILSEIKGLKGVGLSAREAQVSGRLANVHNARENIIELVGGIPEGIAAVGEKGVEKKGLEGIRHSLRNALIAGKTNSIVGWKDLLDIISFKDKTSKLGESAISQFGDVLDANNAEKQGNINHMSAFRAMTFEAYGLESDSDMVKKFTQDAIEHDLGDFKTKNGVFVKLIMSRAEARKRAMEIMDPTLHDTIFTPEGMGWTQEMADAVFDFLTPQDENFITKQLEFYQKYYESINEVYKIIYGVNLPKNVNYTPIAREGISQDVESTLGEFFNEISLRASATSAGGLKSRVANKLPLRPQSDISVIQQHVSDMEHFKAWSEKIRDLNAVFGNSEVRQAIRVNFGDKIDGEIQRFIIDMARGGTEVSKRMATLDGMMGRYARSVLAIKPSIFLKQLTSTVAYADSIPVVYWTKEVLKVHEIPKAVAMFFDEKTGSTLVKSRWAKGDIERDISNAMKSAEFSRLRAKPSFLNAMMFNVKLGDMGAIIIGGYPVYKYYRSRGLSHADAIKRFESVTESTQQSADVSQQSSWQRGGSFAKLFTMFMSSPNQYLRKEISALRNFAAGRMEPTQFAKTMLIYHIILPMFFQLASDRFVWGPDEDDEALIPGISAEQKRAMILGSLNGFFIVGDALEAVVSKALDLKVFGFENPLWSIVNDAMKALPLIDWDDIDSEDFIRAIRGLAGSTGAITGLPAKQAVDITTGFNKTLSGEYETGIAQMTGWSPHQAERATERSEE